MIEKIAKLVLHEIKDDCSLRTAPHIARGNLALMIWSAYHLHENFGGKFPSNGTGIFLGTENRNGIELYHLQNTGKVFAFSGHEAWL